MNLWEKNVIFVRIIKRKNKHESKVLKLWEKS